MHTVMSCPITSGSVATLLARPTLLISFEGCARHRARGVKVLASSSTAAGNQVAPKCVVEPGSLVLVAGASGGVGQLLTAKLLERGYRVRALTRAEEIPRTLLGADGDKLEVVQGDTRSAAKLKPLVADVDAVCCCTGTTAFPTKRWDGNNGPEQTDFVGVKNLVDSCPPSLRRFVLLSSVGVERPGQFPYLVLNLFGVLKYKRQGEEVLKRSGLPFTILRPGRLTDGPYTSYDLNTLLKATSGDRKDVTLSLQDELNGEASRIAVAEAALQSLLLQCTEGKAFAITSNQGEGPGEDTEKWRQLFTSCA